MTSATLYETNGSCGTDGRLSLKPKSSMKKTKEGEFKTYRQVVNHLLETYATEIVVAEV